MNRPASPWTSETDVLVTIGEEPNEITYQTTVRDLFEANAHDPDVCALLHRLSADGLTELRFNGGAAPLTIIRPLPVCDGPCTGFLMPGEVCEECGRIAKEDTP